jgi:hypothetical protein
VGSVRFEAIAEAVDDGVFDEQLSSLDLILVEVEQLREDIINNLSELGFKEAEINSGVAEQKAYWGWTFAIESDDQCLDCTIILYLDADDVFSRYSVEVSTDSGRAWATANNATTETVGEKAFDELKRLFALIAQETACQE